MVKQLPDALIDRAETKFLHCLSKQRLNFLMPCRCHQHPMPESFQRFGRIVQHIFLGQRAQFRLVGRIVVIEGKKAVERNHPVGIAMQVFQ